MPVTGAAASGETPLSSSRRKAAASPERAAKCMGRDAIGRQTDTRLDSDVDFQARRGLYATPFLTNPWRGAGGFGGDPAVADDAAGTPRWPLELERTLASLLGRLGSVMVRGQPPPARPVSHTAHGADGSAPTAISSGGAAGVTATSASTRDHPTAVAAHSMLAMVGLNHGFGTAIATALRRRDALFLDWVPPPAASDAPRAAARSREEMADAVCGHWFATTVFCAGLRSDAAAISMR